ncbi:hypothetical protein ACFL3P_03370 [Pseudomonadota bacterium]
MIYHRRDGPILDTGPPVGTGPPGGVGPPRTQGNWLELILRKNEINGKALALKWFRTSEERNNINLNKRKMKMKNFKLKRLLSLALVGGLSTLGATTVFAAAGETISNTATLQYSVGGTGQPNVTGSVDFVEDNLVNFVVTWGGVNEPATPGAAGQMMTFDVTNNGNGAQDFALSTASLLVDFAVSIDSVVVESGATAGYQALEDTAVYIDELGVGATTQVYVFSTMPPAQPDGDTASVTLTATAHAGDPAGATGALGAILLDDAGNADIETGAGAEQNVFNDPAGATDVAQDGLSSVNGTYVIVAANLTVTKAVATLWDPINEDVAPKAIPGALVRYTITVSNAAGGASADLTTLSDDLAGTLELDLDFLDGIGAVPAATSGVDEAFLIDTSGTGRTAAGTSYCTATTVVDGCVGVAGPPGSVSVDFSTLAVTGADDIAPAGAGPEDYTAGELKAGESITITFNAIVQ